MAEQQTAEGSLRETGCEHEWVSENEIASAYAHEMRQICRKCGELRRTVIRPRRPKESFQELYEKFHGE